MLVKVIELILGHPAQHLFEYLFWWYDACLFEKFHLLETIHLIMRLLFNWIVHALSDASFDCAHFLPFFLIMFVARVIACSMLLLRPCMRLKSSQLTRGVGSCSHACLRLLCFVSSVMMLLSTIVVTSATLFEHVIQHRYGYCCYDHDQIHAGCV